MLSLPNAQEDLMTYENLSQIIVYEDDSLEISFKDNSTLQLSPCGANFKYSRPQSGPQPYLAKRLNEVSQRCVFATSETRKKITQALIIRNRICHHPYVISDFAKEMKIEPFRLYKQLEEFEWPQLDDIQSIVLTNDRIVAKENFAQLELLPDGHKVRVHFAARLSDDNVAVSRNTSLEKCPPEGSTNTQHLYTWQKQLFPASQCPEAWRYPLQLLRSNCKAQATASDAACMSQKNTTRAPQSLPKKCPKQFAHKWRNSVVYGNPSNGEIPEGTNSIIKYLWCDGDSYWISNTDTSAQIEVWMSNGNILKSHPTNDRYFVHMCPNFSTDSGNGNDLNTRGQFVEKIMSSASIPYDSKLKSLFLRAIRLLTYTSQSACPIEGYSPCWKEDRSKVKTASTNSFDPTRLDLQENTYISGVGTFSAVGDSIQISFDDGTMLHMFVTISNFCTKSTPGQCRIVLKDGQYFVIEDVNHADPKVAQYVAHAYSWVNWLTKPDAERAHKPFYLDTIYDEAKVDMISQELEKIHKITDSNAFGETSSKDLRYLELSGGRKCMTFQDVSSALSHTSKAIDDLEQMISSFRKDSAK